MRAIGKFFDRPSYLEELVSEVEEEARRDSEQNAISSADIGEMVLNRLADKNEVAYVRFASVYKNFKSLQEFQDELVKMQKR